MDITFIGGSDGPTRIYTTASLPKIIFTVIGFVSVIVVAVAVFKKVRSLFKK